MIILMHNIISHSTVNMGILTGGLSTDEGPGDRNVCFFIFTEHCALYGQIKRNVFFYNLSLRIIPRETYAVCESSPPVFLKKKKNVCKSLNILTRFYECLPNASSIDPVVLNFFI